MKNLLLFLVIAIQPILAQKANVAQPFSVTSIQINIKKNTPQLVDLPGNATSFVLELNQNTNIGNTTIKTDSETFIVKRAAHQGDTQNNTELIVFEKAITSFTITSDALEGTFSAKSIYVTPIAIDNNYSNARLSADCPKPEVIPISTWRAGLTPPKELPVQSVVKHVIVHHAAGSNTNTNYVDVVRNIYVFHTASNGWNDVGYNFLIAQDGTIFEGRDGQKIADGDNVIGAHFCSQNTGTMGICLLGDYMLVQPPQKAIDALAKLIAWKEAKEKIDPLARTIHVASGKNLFNISAHRDGSCSTDCPGDNLYVKLAEIRQNTVAACADGTVVVVPPPVVVPIVTGVFNDELNLIDRVWPNPNTGQFLIETASPITKNELRLINELGQEIDAELEQVNPKKWKLNRNNLKQGLYFLRIEYKESVVTKKVLISNSQ